MHINILQLRFPSDFILKVLLLHLGELFFQLFLFFLPLSLFLAFSLKINF